MRGKQRKSLPINFDQQARTQIYKSFTYNKTRFHH